MTSLYVFSFLQHGGWFPREELSIYAKMKVVISYISASECTHDHFSHIQLIELVIDLPHTQREGKLIAYPGGERRKNLQPPGNLVHLMCYSFIYLFILIHLVNTHILIVHNILNTYLDNRHIDLNK